MVEPWRRKPGGSAFALQPRATPAWEPGRAIPIFFVVLLLVLVLEGGSIENEDEDEDEDE